MTTDEVKMTIKVDPPEHTIAALCLRSDQISREKGWVKDTDERPYHTAFILQVSELSEALEEYRNNKPITEVYYRDAGGTQFQTLEMANKCSLHVRKGEGIPIELADFVIRVCQRCGTDGVADQLDSAFVRFSKDVDPTDPMFCDFERMLAEVSWLAAYAWRAEEEGDQAIRVSRLAAALTVVFSFCEIAHIDLWAAIDEKEAYNRTRPMRHGGKKI